eukprot:2869503-Rhodomonas_salina.1
MQFHSPWRTCPVNASTAELCRLRNTKSPALQPDHAQRDVSNRERSGLKGSDLTKSARADRRSNSPARSRPATSHL